MSPVKIKALIRSENFEPCVVVTTAGERYEVRDWKLAQLTESGILYVFQPSDRYFGMVKMPTRIGYADVAAIEPLKEKAV